MNTMFKVSVIPEYLPYCRNRIMVAQNFGSLFADDIAIVGIKRTRQQLQAVNSGIIVVGL